MKIIRLLKTTAVPKNKIKRKSQIPKIQKVIIREEKNNRRNFYAA